MTQQNPGPLVHQNHSLLEGDRGSPTGAFGCYLFYGLSWLIVVIPLTVVSLMPRSNSWKGAWSMLLVSTVGLPLFLFRPTRAPLRSQHDRRAPLAQNPPRARSPQRLLDRVLASTGLLARCIYGRVHSSDRPSDRWSLCTLAPVHATKTSQGFKMSKKSQKIQQ